MILKFSKEWDKLTPEKFKKEAIFTTFRKHDKGKIRYYDSNVGKLFDVKINNNVIGEAKLLKVDVKWSDELTPEEVRKDTYEFYDRWNWVKLIRRFYGVYPVMGLMLYFEVTKDREDIE